MAFFDFLHDSNRERQAVGGFFSFLRNTGVGTARSIARIPETAFRSGYAGGTELANATLGKIIGFNVEQNANAPSPTDPIRRFLYGSEPVETYQSRAKGVAKRFNLPTYAAAPIALATIGLDVTPGGGGKKKVAQEVFENLAKTTGVNEVKTILTKQFGPDIAEKTAGAIAKTNDKNIIKNILGDASRPYRAATQATPPTPVLNDVIPGGREVVQNANEPNAFDEITNALSGVKTARSKQNVLLSEQRGQRFGASKAAGETAEGSAGYFAEKSALAGKYGQAEYKPLVNDIGPDEAEGLFAGARRQIQNTPDSVYDEMGLHPQGAKLNTQTAVRKVLGLEPGIPTDSEIKLLEVFSPKLAEEAKLARPKNRALFDFASKLFGSARSIKSSTDFSMGGRQGLFVAARHPVLWAKANGESLKFAKSGQYYKDYMKGIEADPWVAAAGNRDLGLTGILGHEEAYAGADVVTGKVAKDVLKAGNVVAGSERAYTGGLTKLRADLWKSRLQAYGKTPEEAAANLGKEGMDGLAEAVRTLTGRGGKAGGFVQKHATTLNEALFSPRLWASRLQPFNPKYWSRIGPAGRKEAYESLGAFAAVASVALGAAAVAGAEVERDPRSSDFLKIKVGDTRYDILGGFQQNLVFGARQLLGTANTLSDAVTPGEKSGFNFKTTKSSQSGRLSQYGEGYGAPTQLSAVFDLVRNKANPVLSAGANIIEGKDRAGNRINPLTEIGQLFVPISIQGSYHALQDEGVKGVAKNLPDIVGIGTQTYGTKDINLSDNQKVYIDKLQKSGAPKDQVDASKLFYQTLRVTPGRTQATDDIKKALKAGNIDQAIQIAKKYNQEYASSFGDWAKQYGQYAKDPTLYKEYSSNLITDNTIDTLIRNLREAQ